MNEDLKKDLTGALRALESNNQVVPQEEKEKRDTFVADQAESASASLIKPLRTFEMDTADFIKQGQHSVYSIKQAEDKKHPKAPVDPEKVAGRKNAILLFLSAILLLAGISFILYYFLFREVVEAPVHVTASDSLVASQVTTEVTTIRGAFEKTQNGQDDIEYIRVVVNGAVVPIDTILSDLSGGSAPGSLLRSLNKTTYMLGNIQKDTKQPFIIARIDSYDSAFGGMLQWEPTMSTLFDKLTLPQGTSTLEKSFRDILVKNKDARVLRDEAGSIRIVYSFYDKKTLIIATNETTLATLINSLRTAQVAQ